MKKEIIKVGLDDSAPFPLHSDYHSGLFEGFEVDLLQMISDSLNLELHYTVNKWSDVLEKMKKREIDMICTAVTITEERKSYIDFSEPYLAYCLGMVCHRDSLGNEVAKNGSEIIGVRRDTTAMQFAMNYYSDHKLLVSDSNRELYEFLIEKKIDCLIDDSPIIWGHITGNDQFVLKKLIPGSESTYAIALQKGDLELKYKINNALRDIKKKGQWKILYKKWFSYELL